jgi:L-alanine-DL-glutamate epimerase-like enolase superfamily enzyme
MKIIDVQAMVLDTGCDYPDPEEALEAHGVRFVSLVRIETDCGLVGWSDIETQPHVAKAVVDAPSSSMIGFESLRNALIGENPLEHERLWQKMYRFAAYYGRSGAGMHVLSGLDIALWDLAGKALGQPVSVLLGGRYRESVMPYASTLMRPTPEAVSAAVAGYIESGFRAIKFGWGMLGEDLGRDIELAAAARQAAGAEVTLMLDPGWYGLRPQAPFRPRSLKDWIRFVDALESLQYFWIEDFLHPENIEGYRAVSDATRSLRVAAGEQASGYREFERLAVEGGVAVLQPDLSRCGGLTVGRQVADLATRRQIDCCPHAWLTDLLKAASLHLNAYLQHALFLEFNVSTASILTTLCTPQIGLVDGHIPVPTGPGLGVDVDEDQIAHYRVA